MSQPILIKVYGNLSPVSEVLVADLRDCVASAMGETPVENIIDQDNDLLRFSFEGVYFPVDEVIETIENYRKSTGESSKKPCGKLDVLDMENWKLNRYLIDRNQIVLKSAPLNNILDYSGH